MASLLALAIASSPLQAADWGTWRVLGPIAPPTKVSRPPLVEMDLTPYALGGPGPSPTSGWRDLQASDHDPSGVAALVSMQLPLPGLSTKPGAPPSATTSYLCVDVTASTDEVLPVWIGSDDSLSLWLDGVQIVRRDGPRGLRPRADCVPLRLKAGVNWLLVRLDWLESADWRFQVEPFVAPSGAEIDEAIRRGCHYLADGQYPDGTWGGEAAHTALILHALFACDHPRERGLVRLAERALLAQRLDTVDALAWSALALAESDESGAHDAAVRASASLVKAQDPQGRWHSGTLGSPGSKPSLTNTTLAIRALANAGARGAKLPKEFPLRGFAGITAWRAEDDTQVLGRGPRTLGFADQEHGPLSGRASVGGLAGLVALTPLMPAAGATLRKQHEDSVAAARAWLERELRFDVVPAEELPTAGFAEYLANVARIGVGLGTEYLAGIDWYAAGARRLIDLQAKDGSFPSPSPSMDRRATDTTDTTDASAIPAGPKPTGGWVYSRETSSYVATAHALRFLASRPRVHTLEAGARPGERLAAPRPGTEPVLSIAVHDEARVRVRIVAVREEALLAGTDRPIPVARVELHVRRDKSGSRPVVVGTLPGGDWTREDLSRWSGEFELGRGPWLAQLVLCLAGTTGTELRSPEARVWIQPACTDELLAGASDSKRNLLAGVQTKVSSSSVAADGHPSAVCDGRLATVWSASIGDGSPWIQVELARQVPAQRILLTQMFSRGKDSSMPAVGTAEITVNGGEPIRIEMPREIWRKGVVELPQRVPIRTLRVRSLKTLRAREDAGIGIAEIELQLGGEGEPRD